MVCRCRICIFLLLLRYIWNGNINKKCIVCIIKDNKIKQVIKNILVYINAK